MSYPTHIDLFSGIGGFTLACQWAGIQTEVFCEKDERCRAFLERSYPTIPIVPDIRDFDGTKWRGRFLLTGGVPCQPASRAGKQRGKGDDRWLWPEAIRVVGEALPRWCLFENPPGIYDVGIDGILSDLEGIGYEVGTVEIPACAINSPQIRQRVWIIARCVGNSESGTNKQVGEVWQGKKPNSWGRISDLAHPQGRQNDSGRDGNMADPEGCREGGNPAIGCGGQGDMADTETAKHECSGGTWTGGEGFTDNIENQWDSYLWTPCADGKLRRTPDDSFGLVDGLHRSVLAALGNSIVPQVAYEIIKAIKESHG